jgi:cation diffusion facilitator CzcD-associated flavoprotein CzcO
VVDVLLCACGQLSVPAWPRVEGLDAFRGRAFHSAQWNEDHDLTGERVAVIGTGASSIQIIPRIAPIVERLYVYRRSAPYVVPKPERTYSARHHRLFRRFPFLLRAERLTAYLSTELLQLGITSRPALLRPWVATWRFNMHRAVRDDAKRAALTPDYDPGCKRVLFSSDYYPAMARDNVEIIPAGVSALTATGVVSDSGEFREVDAVIFATGFQAQRFVAPMRIHGRAGLELADAWADGARAYLGMSVPDFPNLFLLYGPNTNVGGGSMIYMLESSARYIVEALKVLATRPGSALELRPEILERYDAEIQDRLSRTAWQSGCHSWYIDDRGRHANNWPGLQREYRRRTRRFQPGHYHLLGDGTPEARAGETSAAVAP